MILSIATTITLVLTTIYVHFEVLRLTSVTLPKFALAGQS